MRLLLRDNLRNRSRIERAYRRAIGNARHEVIIANAYFLPGRKLRHALVLAARRQVAGDSEGLVAKGFAMAAAPVWCLLTARELSWGAALLPPIDFSAEGPVYSSAHLWYKPAVVPLALIVLAWCAWVLLRSRILRAVPALLRSPQFVWAELAILLLAAALSTYAEGHLGIPVASFLQGRAVVVEEWAELFAYFALVVAQWQILVLLRHAGDRLASQ